MPKLSDADVLIAYHHEDTDKIREFMETLSDLGLLNEKGEKAKEEMRKKTVEDNIIYP